MPQWLLSPFQKPICKPLTKLGRE